MPFRTKKTRVYQYDIVVGGHRFRGSCGTEDFEAAKAVEADIRANAKRNAARGSDYTLSEALGTYTIRSPDAPQRAPQRARRV